MNNWDQRFLDLAEWVSKWSKDPSTQVGAVIVRPDKTVASLGYNGFPRGVVDSWDRLFNREAKYALVVHGELNAILHAREPLHGYTIYLWPFPPCSACAGAIIQVGIKRVVAPASENERWVKAIEVAREMFIEADVQLEEVQ